MAASMVLRSIAEDPPASLTKIFDKIIHVDCSVWKSRRALQRAIAVELMLPQEIMAIFDRQDDEDDFIGADEGSRSEIQDVGEEIHRALQGHTCLVVFHNGGKEVIDMNDFGIPESSKWLNNGKVLWTFRGRLRLVATQMMADVVNNSHFFLSCRYPFGDNVSLTTLATPEQAEDLRALLQAEAREIAHYTHAPGVNEEITTECCFYLLLLSNRNEFYIDYNWATHASNYWVCDGIIEEGQEEKAWDIGAALHKELQLAEYTWSKIYLPIFHGFESKLDARYNRWFSAPMPLWQQIVEPTVLQELSSFFLAISKIQSTPLLDNTYFEQLVNLGVLKLRHCTFNFSLPPFRSCVRLRFLGLDSCTDDGQKKKKENPVVLKCFQSLRVLDIRYTDWDMTWSPEIIESLAAVVREIHIKKGSIWSRNRNNNLACWQQMGNLRKLRVIEPTCPWETGKMDDFSDTIKLELLDLSGNGTIHVLPSLSDATNLKTLILDGCVGLEHVGPHGLPPALESLSFDAGKDRAKVSIISFTGCKNLHSFILRGRFWNLEELDLSGTSVKILNLSGKVVQLPRLERLLLLGCKQLCAIVWWGTREEMKLKKLYIDTHGEVEEDSEYKNDYDAYAVLRDARLVQSLMVKESNRLPFRIPFRVMGNLRVHLRKPAGSSQGRRNRLSTSTMLSVEKTEHCLSDNPACYRDILQLLQGAANAKDASSADDIPTPVPLAGHVEISEGMISTPALESLMASADSLDLASASGDASIISTPYHGNALKWCRVERCSALRAAFPSPTTAVWYDFFSLETILVAHLPAARCIWGERIISTCLGTKLRTVHLRSCPRLKFVLPMLAISSLTSLEILHVAHCGDLTHVFPFDDSQSRLLSPAEKATMTKEFPKLKRLHLHHLPKLQQVCELRMSAPALETVKVRDCWGLRRLPATAVGRQARTIVDCEKDWWEKLEWDGLEAGHHRSLFQPRHSRYYKKALLRASVLR
ncbi:unnamed protein product [Urochloa decumbens]|uniref:Disease resistance protein At4g27190-like leucine-rich repeats domain-containing protein n=1 Tax=Urochloa decumbens TaxID=240449 RepID=A0ABC9EX73_9POAL